MANRSNIKLVGNTVSGQNTGIGTGIFKCKSDGNNLLFKSISTTGTSLCIVNTDNQIYISGTTGGGSGILWTGNAVGGIGTYVNSSTICSEPKLKFNTNGLYVTGKTYISGITTGQSTNIIHYDTVTHELYTCKLTAGIDGALQFNDNGVLGGTNLFWNADVNGFTWGTGYTPTTDNVITILKTCDYRDGTPTGFISMGIDSLGGQDMFNLCYTSNYLSGGGSCFVISSTIPLHIQGYNSESYLQLNDYGFYLKGSTSRNGLISAGCTIQICGDYGVQLNNTWFCNNEILSNNDYVNFCQYITCTLNQMTNQYYSNEKFILTNNTTSTTPVLLAYGSAKNQYICLTEYYSNAHHTAMAFDACVIGVDAVSGATASFFFEGAIKRVSGGTVSFVGTPAKVSYKDTVLSAADANVYANNTDKRLDICVCGLTSKNIIWSAVVNSLRIKPYYKVLFGN